MDDDQNIFLPSLFFFEIFLPYHHFFFAVTSSFFFHIPTATKFYNNPLTLPHTPSYCVNVCCIHPTDWLVGSRGYQDQKLLFFFCVSPYPLYNLHLDTIKKKGRKKKLKKRKKNYTLQIQQKKIKSKKKTKKTFQWNTSPFFFFLKKNMLGGSPIVRVEKTLHHTQWKGW